MNFQILKILESRVKFFSGFKLLKIVLQVLSYYKFRLLAGLFSSFIHVCTGFLIIYAIKSGYISGFGAVITAIITGSLLSFFTDFLFYPLNNLLSITLRKEVVKNAVFNSGQTHSLHYYIEASQWISSALNSLIRTIGRRVPQLFFFSILLFYTDWKLTLILFSCLPFYAAGILFTGKLTSNFRNKFYKSDNEFYKLENSLYNDADSLKLNTYPENISVLLNKESKEIEKSGLDYLKAFGVTSPFSLFFFSGVLLLIYFFNYIFIVNADSFTNWITAAVLLYQPLSGSGSDSVLIVNFLRSDKSVFESNFKRNPSVQFEKLSIDNLNFSYGQKELLKNISFELEIGKNCIITGKNGSGKTTLLKLIAGLIPSTEIKFNNNLNATDISIEFVSSNPEIIYKNVEFTLNPSGNEKGFKYFPEFYIPVDDSSFFFTAKSMSTGEKKKICITRALNSDSRILLLDEPFAGLDSNSLKWLINFINNDSNRSYIISSHFIPDELKYYNKIDLS